jgi:hypothetical protein
MVTIANLMLLGVGAFINADDPSFLVHPGRRRHIHKVKGTANDVIRINYLNIGSICRIENRTGNRFAANVFCCTQDYKVGVVNFFIDTLPHGHVKKASSPGGPGHDQGFFTLQIGHAHNLAFPVSDFKIWRHRIDHHALTPGGYFRKTPDSGICICYVGLAEQICKCGQVKPLFATLFDEQGFINGDAQFGVTNALGL